jgi:hypothetical protein
MQNNPSLIVNRLIVLDHNNKMVYDQLYHKGVNIIRGENSSGKSTIANFLFYILGGDYSNWNTEALKCQQVIAEVVISGAIITLKRNLGANGQQPLSIYYGPFEASRTDMLNWKVFPYKQTTNILSFSNVLFSAFGFPEVKGDESNITMHQVLRLLYIDQDTPTQNLFRIERFDLPLTRQAVAELLLGIYDDSLYNARIEVKLTSKQLDDKTRELESLNKLLTARSYAGNSLTNPQADLEIARQSLTNVDSQIGELKSMVTPVRVSKRTPSELEKLQANLTAEKNRVSELQETINQYDLEILDSTQFISTLKRRLVELDHSLLTREVLGELPLTHCPECLQQLEPNENHQICSLCRKPLDKEIEKANAKRLRQEIEIQIRESSQLMNTKQERLAELSGELPRHVETARILQKELNRQLQTNESTRNERVDQLLIEKGSIEQRIAYLTEQLKISEYLSLLQSQIVELTAKITQLKLAIQIKEREQVNKYTIALTTIKKYITEILQKDLGYQNEFKNPTNIEVDFVRDYFALNESNNFSASSKTYFKNSVLFAIFFASLELPFFRYPRFILCDNMEDKGMEKQRTQNFQEVITTMAQRFTIDYQIIFTTSMVSDTLNNTELCVGPEYHRNSKSLNT